MSLLHAFRKINYVEHNDGTPDTEIVDILCFDCAWKSMVEGGELSTREISYQLHEEWGEYEGDSLEHLKKQMVDYTQALGEVCEHLEASHA